MGNNRPKLNTINDTLKALAGEQAGLEAVEGLGDVVQTMVSSLKSEFEAATHRVSGEIQELIDYINSSKEEIAALNPMGLSKVELPGAADELDAIVTATEDAAGSFMDAADDLRLMAKDCDPEMTEKLEAIATRIFEASAFQDITGQRITKVVKVLKKIESRLTELAETFDEDTADISENSLNSPDDDKLLHGPALPGQGNNQDDVDALFSNDVN